jgi:hypothetical protein
MFEQFITQTNASMARQEASITRLERVMEESNRRSEKEHRELARQLGDISNRLGTIVEDIIAPNLRRLASAELNCGDVIRFMPRVTQRHPRTGLRRGFDVIVEGSQAVLFTQTKTTARSEYAQEFVEWGIL